MAHTLNIMKSYNPDFQHVMSPATMWTNCNHNIFVRSKPRCPPTRLLFYKTQFRVISSLYYDSPWEPAAAYRDLGFTELIFVNNDNQLGRQASQMMADHGDPCMDNEATYCMNGGTCYKIPFMDSLSCVCSSSFKGSRCEQFQLLSTSTNGGHPGLITAVVIVTLLVLTVLAFLIYYACKTWKSKPESTRSGRQQYWRVRSRV